MKHCDTCGGLLIEEQPFSLCPKCLFGGAIKARDALGEDITRNHFRLTPRPDFFEKYDLLEKLAGGGQGEVWKTWDFEFHRCVAMKRIAGHAITSLPAVHRFLAEAQIAGQLEHPGILPIFDVGLDPDGRPYYTTQLLPGTTLEDVWREVHSPKLSGWTLNRALELLLRICDVMGHAHSRGVIHRDLKPANILVGSFGDVRIVDWGSAHLLNPSLNNFDEAFEAFTAPAIETDRSRAMDDPESPLATATAGQPITLLYTPPEIMAGEPDAVGPATDIYAMGVMIYQLLTGKSPYASPAGQLPGREPLRQMILAGSPPSPRALSLGVSRDLAAICQKAMAHRKTERYASMADLAEDIRAALEIRPVKAREPGVLLRLQKWSHRNFSYVLLAGGALLLLSIALSSAHGFKAQRDAARQTTSIRNAELAARNGQWREALRDWDQAETAGYHDAIYLDLQRAEAWTILNEPERAGALLHRLAVRPDLDGQRGTVLLRLGEHELFEGTTPAHGVQLVQQAMTAGLTNADLFFARGLLADSTPAALDLFHQALQYNPYHHGAHRHSMSLEFLLGRHEQLTNHLAVFRILYPDDPSPGFIAATEAAMAGDVAGAQARLESVRGEVNSNVWNEASRACQAYATAAKFYDVEDFLRQQPPVRTPLDTLRTNPFSAGVLLMPGQFAGITNQQDFRVPRLPCIQKGLLAAGDGLSRLLQPYLASPVVAVQEIEAGWSHHPEALIPVLAGMLLENQQPTDGPPVAAVLERQARLYQMAADSPSMMPQMGRLARYLAARAEFELANREPANSPSAISNCLADIRQAVAAPDTSAAECHAYFQFALALGDNDLALQLVTLLEKRAPNDSETKHSRVQVQLAMGAFGPALERINQILLEDPHDSWAMEQRRAALSGLTNAMIPPRFPAN